MKKYISILFYMLFANAQDVYVLRARKYGHVSWQYRWTYWQAWICYRRIDWKYTKHFVDLRLLFYNGL